MVAKSLKKPRRRTPTPSRADQPLLRVLVAEATRRGDTLAKMAAQLGVSYQHVTQWRRNEYDIAKASRLILEAAGRYLKVPTVTVLSLAGVITLEDFSEPAKSSLLARLRLDLERMRQDPFFAGFVPDALESSDTTVQRFVAFMYRELCGGYREGRQQFEWVRTLELAAMGHAQAQSELAALMSEQSRGEGQNSRPGTKR